MSMGIRDLMEITIRANDQASGTINGVASATGALGTAMSRGSLRMFAYSQGFEILGRKLLYAGGALLGAAAVAGHFAMSFDHAMALAQTQAQLTQKQFEATKQAALDVSSQFGVSADVVASSLYDIFSTTNDTYRQAIGQIKILAKAAVAGSTDMATATKGVIDIQNAFGLSASSTTRILNLQFQMLRKSGGTYDELVSAFGNVIGAARNTDQQLRTVAGSIAFLTLRGRTQAQASISVSRALDQIAKSAGDIKSTLGISVFDATGNFKQLNDIIDEMAGKMADMTSKQRSAAFIDMFGQGSIQANRFFRTAILQSDELNKSVDALSKKQIAGQLQKAFDYIRKNDPTYVFNRLKEGVKNFGIAVFNAAIPAIQQLVGWLQKAVDWLNNLSPNTKKMIGQLVVFAGVVLTVSGAIMLFVSQITHIISIFKLAATAVSGFSLVALAIVAVVALIAYAAYYVYQHWDKFGPYFKRLWATVQKGIQAFIKWFQANLLPPIMAVVDFLIETWNGLVAWWDENGAKITKAAGKVVSWFVSVFKAFWRTWGEDIVNVAKMAWDFIKETIRAAMEFIQGVIEVVTGIINGDWSMVWDGIKKIVAGAWKSILAIIRLSGKLMVTVVAAGLKLLVRLWFEAWRLLFKALGVAWRAILRFLGNIPHWIMNVFKGALNWLAKSGKSIMTGLWNGIKAAWKATMTFFLDIPNKIANFFSGAINWLLQAGKDVISGFIHGLESAWGGVVSWLSQHTAAIPGIKGPKAKDMKLLYDNGRAVMMGFRYGMDTEWRNVESFLNSRTAAVGDVVSKGQRRNTPIFVGGDTQHIRDVHLHIEPKHSTVDGKEAVREMDWARRTRGW